jgi:GT2 family glycosyltransferase
VAIVVVTYNSARVVGALLDSIPAALGQLTSDVVVVDNGSSDGTRDLLKSRIDCRLIESSNDGYAAGINKGIRAAFAAEAILILNPDVLLEPDSIVRFAAAFAAPRAVLDSHARPDQDTVADLRRVSESA